MFNDIIRADLFLRAMERAQSVVGLNNIPVFVSPIGSGSSCLVSKESMNALTFTEFEDDVYVRAVVEPIEGNDMLINLRLTWRFKPDLIQSDCWQISYTK